MLLQILYNIPALDHKGPWPLFISSSILTSHMTLTASSCWPVASVQAIRGDLDIQAELSK